MTDYHAIADAKHTLASACNLSSSGNSYLAGIIGLLIENLLILAWGLLRATCVPLPKIAVSIRPGLTALALTTPKNCIQ
jgi:hypothetical protein